MAYNLELAKPEEVGLPSSSINNFIKKLKTSQLPIHSILISRYGKLVTEAYYPPFQKKTLHRMFSVSKSFTSIAIGLLITHGELAVSDKIIDYFPEKLPDSVHPFLSEMTLEHLLTMRTCHTQTTFKDNPNSDWVESFFTTPPSHRPGTSFNYDTSASHVLAALVEKLTGMPLLDYLKVNLLNHLDFTRDSYILKDPFGVSMGGSGLMATPMDLMKFSLFLMAKGKIGGHRFLDPNYIETGTELHSHTLLNGPTQEERQGYGYQFWRIQHKGYACYGMGGQLVLCFPDLGLTMVTTADTMGTGGGHQLIYNALYEEILPFLSNHPLPADPTAFGELGALISSLELEPLSNELTPQLMETINNRVYVMRDHPLGFDRLSLDFINQKEGHFRFTLKGEPYNLPFGIGFFKDSPFPLYSTPCVSSAKWLDSSTLYIKSHLMGESLGSVHLQLTFSDNHLSVYMKKYEENLFTEFDGYLEACLSPD